MHRHLATIVLAVTLAFINGTAVAQHQFDGHWNVKAVPDKGACHRTHRYAVVIENGTIRNDGSRRMRVNIAGGLEASGRIRGSVQRNKTRVDVTGSLSGGSGSGDWTSAGRVTCAGRWTAEKRN